MDFKKLSIGFFFVLCFASESLIASQRSLRSSTGAEEELNFVLETELGSPNRKRKQPEVETPVKAGKARRLIESPGTPVPVKALAEQFISPNSVTIDYSNYCKKMIAALNAGNKQKFSEIFQDFNTTMPYDMVPKSGETDGKSDRLLFYKALFYKIFSEFGDNKPTLTAKGVENLVNTEKNEQYALRFHYTEENNDPGDYLKFIKRYKDAIGIMFHLDVSKGDQYTINTDLVDISGQEVFPQLRPLVYNQGKFRTIIQLLDTDKIDTKKFSTVLNAFFKKIPEELLVKKEYYFQKLFYAMFMFIRNQTAEIEVHHQAGRSDSVVKFPSRIKVMEWKLNEKNPDLAVNQISTKRYCDMYRGQGKPIEQVGINVIMKNRKFVKAQVVAKPYKPEYRQIKVLTLPKD